MLKDVPYSVLKENERAYAIMLLRDQNGEAFSRIAKKFGLSVSRASQIYFRMKYMQARLYINHISLALGHDGLANMRKLYATVLDCYQENFYACAYFEREYGDILAKYREGEPGMSEQFIKNLPPLKAKLSEEEICLLIDMRDSEKAPFTAIGRRLKITPEKARRTYEKFYHDLLLNGPKNAEKKDGGESRGRPAL